VQELVDWGKSVEIFIVGFGGVFLTLLILQTGVRIFSKIIASITNMTKKKTQKAA